MCVMCHVCRVSCVESVVLPQTSLRKTYKVPPEVIKEESHLTLIWHAEVSFVNEINLTNHFNSEKPCTTTQRAINLTILTVSRPGDFSRVESNENAVSTPGSDQTIARCIVTSKSSLAHATVVTDNEPCHFFFFGHVCKNERTRRVCTAYMSSS